MIRVVKPEPQIGPLRHTQTQTATHIGKRHIGTQSVTSLASVEERSVGTQAGESDLQSAYECIQHIKLAKVSPVAPIHLNHSFDFGTHRVALNRAPNRPVGQRFAPPNPYFQQFIQQPVYHQNQVPPSFQHTIPFQPYQIQPVQYAPNPFIPVQSNPTVAGPSVSQRERKRLRNIKKSAAYRKRHPRQE